MQALETMFRDCSLSQITREHKKTDTIRVSKYTTPGDAALIHRRLTPLSQLLNLNLYQAPGIFEFSESEPYKFHPYFLLASPAGEVLLKDVDFFIQLEQNPADFPEAQPVTDNCHSSTHKVTYKGESLYLKAAHLPGREPFETIGMQLLSQAGFYTAEPLITTQSRLVTKQVPGTQLTEELINPVIREKISIFQRLALQTVKSFSSQLWLPYNGSGYKLSLSKPGHYFLRNLHSPDPHDWFTIIDAVAFTANSPQFQFRR